MPIDWREARTKVYEAGRAARLSAVHLPLSEVDGHVLAESLRPLTDLPAFATSSVDGWALRGSGPWRIVGSILAGHKAPELDEDGTTVEIATGAMVPVGTEAILRVEHSTVDSGVVSGTPKDVKEWREPGEEAHAGEELFPSGTRITPGMIGLAASCGHETLSVSRKPKIALIVFGDELLTSGIPADGRVRDALGPSLPAFLHRLNVDVAAPVLVEDTLEAHIKAIREAMEADVIITTGGTMHGPVDHLHPALAALNAEYVVNTVAVRPGFPMMVAALPNKSFVAGLPGNPQSAYVALVSLVMPLLAGLSGAEEPMPSQITLGAPVPGRGDFTHLSLVRHQPSGWIPVMHVGSSMLRGLAASEGFAVIPPHGQGLPGQQADFLELP